jgi:enoyl-CoA hydratase
MEIKCFELEIIEPGIALLTFDRPPVNAQNRRSRQEFIWLMDEVSERDDISVVILTGAGAVFSAGADIKERVGMGPDRSDYLRHNRITREFFYSVTDCKKPVICALNGAAIGAGYALAAGCDLIIASEDAWIQMPELDRGLMGGAKFLERHLPRAAARWLFFTGRKMPAADLARYGMVTEVVPRDALLATALELARDIAKKYGPAVQKAKATFNAVELMPYRDGYRFEQSVTQELSTSDYTREAQRAFLEHRDSDFSEVDR